MERGKLLSKLRRQHTCVYPIVLMRRNIGVRGGSRLGVRNSVWNVFAGRRSINGRAALERAHRLVAVVKAHDRSLILERSAPALEITQEVVRTSIGTEVSIPRRTAVHVGCLNGILLPPTTAIRYVVVLPARSRGIRKGKGIYVIPAVGKQCYGISDHRGCNERSRKIAVGARVVVALHVYRIFGHHAQAARHAVADAERDVLPFTNFSARRKKTGGFSRRSCAFVATGNGESFPGLRKPDCSVSRVKLLIMPGVPGAPSKRRPEVFHRFGSLVDVAASIGKKLP